MTEPQIEVLRWPAKATELHRIRQEVFIHEQGISAEDEWDALDPQALHLLASHEGKALGCARLLVTGKLTRMAVLAGYRRRGLGALLLNSAILETQRLGLDSLSLDAQMSALGFYLKFGFEICSEVFMDAGIPHQTLRKSFA